LIHAVGEPAVTQVGNALKFERGRTPNLTPGAVSAADHDANIANVRIR